MKSILISVLTGLLVSTSVLSQSLPVKKSNSGICYVPGGHYYEQTKKFTPFKALQECLSAGGRMPKR